MGHVVVVLNSLESATDLFVKRALNYSGPLELPMLTDQRLFGWGMETSSLRYAERWKRQRKLNQSALHPSASNDLRTIMVKQARISVWRLLQNPGSIAEEVQWLTASNILSSVYGYQPEYPHDELVDLVKGASHKLGQATNPGIFYVNAIPSLKYVPSWFPGAGWKRKAKLWRIEKDRMVNEPFEWTKTQKAKGMASPSILKNLLADLENKRRIAPDIDEEEGIVRWATGALFAAGADTIDAALMTFALAMVLHPEVQRKAQEEIDSVLEADRLPDLSDRESLPYLNRVLKETLRWNPVAALGIPHICAQDDEYRGYLIPKGAIVFHKIRAICNDTRVYPEPRSFNPDRFLDPSAPDAPVFGMGRRVCPGSYFAGDSLFIMASTLLSIFNFKSTPGKPLPKAEFRMESLAS
ncbi:cytochrome P450 family protein [Ceratobasidium sp. AG-Ba]|nr:cytochrome P450 family protein [Ceratobasidium sp. AG-Ba]